MTSEKFKFNYIISWVFLYLGFQLCVISNLKSSVFINEEGFNSLNVFMNYGAVAMALGIISLFWSFFINIKVSFMRSSYQENKMKLWKIVCISWAGLLILPFIMIYSLDKYSYNNQHVELLAMCIPFVMLAYFGVLQTWGYIVGGKIEVCKKAKSS